MGLTNDLRFLITGAYTVCMETNNNTSNRVTFNFAEVFAPREVIVVQGESPAVHYAWRNNTRIARITGNHRKSLFTVNMECGITLVNKYETRNEAAEAALKFYKDNFYLDYINA